MIWVWLVIANTAMLLHFAFLGFLIGGGFWAWRRRELIWPRLITAGWAFGIETWYWTCPLTQVEQWARLNAGQDGLAPTGFIDTYVQDVMYPSELNDQVLLLIATVVLISWLGYLGQLWRLRRRRRSASPRLTATPS